MRPSELLLCFAGLGLALAGCGGGGEKTPNQAAPKPTTVTAAPTSTTVAGTQAEEEAEYELDVIAEAEPDEGAPPLKVQFTASVEEESGGPFSFSWDFGDGTQKVTDQNPVHTYDKVGEYTATLTVTDQKGHKGTDEIDIFVETDEEGGGGQE
jgi:PKD repeat protein